jgi:hypothetical protein
MRKARRATCTRYGQCGKRGWVLLLACSSMGNDEPTHKLRYSKLRESPVDDSRLTLALYRMRVLAAE